MNVTVIAWRKILQVEPEKSKWVSAYYAKEKASDSVNNVIIVNFSFSYRF